LQIKKGLYELSLTFNKYHVIESPFKVLITDLVESVRLYESQTVDGVGVDKNLRNNQHSYNNNLQYNPQQQSHIDSLAHHHHPMNNNDDETNSTGGAAIGSVCLMSQREFNHDMPVTLEYELTNWNSHLNSSLNKILVDNNNNNNNNSINSTSNSNINTNIASNNNNSKPTKRALTPITDTSEEESQETSKIYFFS
jgi:hypothetical protein